MRSNEDLYHDLIEQAQHLLTTHEFRSSRRRSAKLRETIYLLDAHEAGQDITLAKLAYDPNEYQCDNPIVRLRHHLGAALPDAVSTAIDLGHGFYVMPTVTRISGGRSQGTLDVAFNVNLLDLG